MALVLADRIKETTTTTGTGTYTLAGAVTGFESFGTVGNGNTTYYCCTDGSDFEVGVGTYTSSGTTLARTTILQSSNSDNAVDWSAGTRDIFCTQPAEKAVFLDGDGKLGVGTDDPQQLLHVAYSSSGTDLTTGAGSDLSTGMRVNNTNTTTNSFASIDLRANNADVRLASVFKGANQSDFVVLVDKAGGFSLEEALRVSSEGDVTITSSDADANPFPNLVLFRNSASPADNDDLGKIFFRGRNDNSQDVDYHSILSEIADASDGTEDARLYFKGMSGGSDVTYIQLKFGRVYLNRAVRFEDDLEITGGKGVEFQSSSDSTIETRVVADPSADRTITLPDATGTVLLTDGSGASLTSLNASELGSGTVPNARLDAQLQDVAGLAVTNGNFIVGDGANFVAESGSTARTSLGLGTAAVLDTGISNTNVPKFTSGVVDDDFLRVNGTDIEGRSASEVLSDIGGQASLTFGISNTNAVKIDSSSVADDEFARFTANGLESRSASEVRSDIGLGTAAVAATGISNGNVPVFTSGVADDDFLRVNGTSIEGRSASEVASDIGAATTDDATALAIALG